MGRKLGTKLCNQLATRQSRFDSPNVDHGGQMSGWFHYMAKDFRTSSGVASSSRTR